MSSNRKAKGCGIKGVSSTDILPIPMGEKILIRRDRKDGLVTEGGIEVIKTNQPEPMTARVLSISEMILFGSSEAAREARDRLRGLKVGDRIVVALFSGTKWECEPGNPDKTLTFIHPDEVIAKVVCGDD